MADLFIKFQVGDVIHTLQVMETAAHDPSPLMADSLLIMIRSSQQNFVEQGRPEKWAPLAPSTIEKRIGQTKKGQKIKASFSKAVQGKIGPKLVKAADKYAQAAASLLILRNTGGLLQSIGGGQSGPFETADGFGASDETSATIGTNHPGAYNQFPDERTGRPERIIFLFQEQDVDDIMDLGVAFFTRTGPYAVE